MGLGRITACTEGIQLENNKKVGNNNNNNNNNKKQKPTRSQASFSSSLCLLFFFIEIRTKNIFCFHLDLNSLCNALNDIEFHCLPPHIIIVLN